MNVLKRMEVATCLLCARTHREVICVNVLLDIILIMMVIPVLVSDLKPHSIF